MAQAAAKPFDDFMKHKPRPGDYSNDLAQDVKDDISDLAKKRTITAVWVGITTRGKKGCKTQWKNKLIIVGMQQIARGYKTTSFKYAVKMKDELIRMYRLYKRNRVQNPTDGNEGIPNDKKKYIVYVAWTTEPNYNPPERVEFGDALVNEDPDEQEPEETEEESDGESEKPINQETLRTVTTLKRRISAHTRNGAPFWIGITSDGEDGCRNRWNTKYSYYGMNRFRMLHTPCDINQCKQMERLLIRFYKERAEMSSFTSCARSFE